jgi:hypothetical protein
MLISDEFLRINFDNNSVIVLKTGNHAYIELILASTDIKTILKPIECINLHNCDNSITITVDNINY